MSKPGPHHDQRPRVSHASRWGFVVTLVATCLLAGPILSFLPGVRVENDVEHWLVSDDEQTRVLRWFVESFPSNERVVVSWNGNSLDDPRGEPFIERLRQATDWVAYVVSPHDVVEWMEETNVSEELAVDRLRGYLVGPKVDDEAIVLIVGVTDLASQKPTQLVNAVRDAAVASGIAIDDLQIAGSCMIRSQLNKEVERVAFNPDAPAWRWDQRSPVLFSILVGVVSTVVVIRNGRASLVVLMAALMSVLVVVSLLPVFDKSLNIVLLVMPTLVFVVTLSATIHTWNYWRQSRQPTSLRAAHAARASALRPCLLASLTTGIGVTSLTVSPLTPVREFGLFSAIGSLTAFLMAVCFIPAVLWVVFRTGSEKSHARSQSSLFARFADLLNRYRVAVTILAAVVCLAAGAGLLHLRTESRIIRYFPSDSRIIADYETIESRVTGIAPVETLVVFDADTQASTNFRERMEQVRRVSREIAAIDSVSGTLCLADFRNEVAKPPASAPFLRKARWFRTGAEMEKRIKSEESGDSILFLNVQTSSEFAEVGDEVWGITAHVSLMDDEVDYQQVTNRIRAAAASTLGEAFDADVYVTGMVPQFLRLQRAVLDSLSVSFLTAFGVIAVVLAVYLRDPIATLWLMIPNLLPVLVVFGIASWAGLAIEIGTMLTASVALGIAVDDSVHVLVAFQKFLKTGTSRLEATRQAMEHAGTALCQTTVVLASGFLVLSTCEMQLISRFGIFMAALLVAALVADLVLLPALLFGPLGRRLERHADVPQSRVESSVSQLTMNKPVAAT